MKAYFKHLLKSNARIIIIISLLMILVSVFVSLDSMDRVNTKTFVYDGEEYHAALNRDIKGTPIGYYPGGNYNQQNYKEITDEEIVTVNYRSLALSTSVTIIIALSVIVPICMFAFLKKKRNLDCVYSLPITKRGIGIVHYAVGGVTVLVPFVCSYVATLVCHASYDGFASLGYGYLLSHFAICLLMGFVLYSICVFVFERANTVVDGVIFIGIYMVGLYFLVWGIESLTRSAEDWRYWLSLLNDPSGATYVSRHHYYFAMHEECAIPAYIFCELLSQYEYCAETLYSQMTKWSFDGTVFWFCFWSVVGVAAAVLAFVFADKKKTESAEEISNSIFGYKLLIPLIAFPFILSNGVLDGYYNEALLVTIGAAVAYTVYRRGVHYKKSDYIIVGTMLALSIISIFAKPIMHDLIRDVIHYGA